MSTPLCHKKRQQSKLLYAHSSIMNLSLFLRKNMSLLSVILIVTILQFLTIVTAMRLDPDRIAARLKIEEEIANDKMAFSRLRRQLAGTPKEETIQVTAQLFSGRLFDYGIDSGDKELPAFLDSAKKIHVAHSIFFYGKHYSSFYILANGAIGFESSARSYRANILPGNVRLIAPFWNRNDLRNGGHVYYREITSGRVLERGQSEIRYQYEMEVTVESAIIVTWDKMQPLATAPLPVENTNTFQMALFFTRNGTFANFIYSNIGWTQGAESGFSNGDNKNHYALPTSGTGNIMYLEDYGNTGIPGEWMFVFGESRLIRCKAGIKGDTCDETCAAGEWGTDCAECCHCESGSSCNNLSGACTKNGGICAECWTGPTCQEKTNQCKHEFTKSCAANALSYTDYDRCGEPSQRCECLAGYEGNGDEECKDIDECSQPETCHEKAICTNTPGRFFCQCISGFNGDGVSECVASFLYPHDNAKKLKKIRNAKVTWQLKYPLKIFGKMQEKIVISSNGLIIVSKDKARVNPGDRLDDIPMLGLAPFFSPIDLSTQRGEVSIVETTDFDVLSRATQLINENLNPNEATFRATSVVTVSFMNVTTSKLNTVNTFQTLLIGGKNNDHKNLTFVQFLYKDLLWSEGAEAGIMTADKINSIYLPGSGTAGIEQLSQLSNIRSPGIWMYRIDDETVSPCIQSDLQPPYCDAQSPTLIGQLRFSVVTKPVTTITPDTITTKFPKITKNFYRGAFPSEPNSQQITPSFPIVESRQFAKKRVNQFTSQSLEPSRSRKPIVPISSKEIAEIPPDAFDFTPMTIKIVPELMTATAKKNPTVSVQPILELVSETPAFVQVDPRLANVTYDLANVKAKTEKQIIKSAPSELANIAVPPTSIIQPEIIRPVLTIESTPSLTAIKFTNKISEAKTEKPVLEFNHDNESGVADAIVKKNDRVIQINPQTTFEQSLSSVKNNLKSVTPSSNFVVTHIESNVSPSNVPANQKLLTTTVAQDTTLNPIFVFSTLTKPKPLKPKLVIGVQEKKKQNQPTESDVFQIPYDPDRIMDAEAPANKFALIITISVIAGWLLVLMGVGAYVACKRSRNQDMLRAMYGPAYQIRPIGVGYATRGEKPYETSYEDHLEKAARLSSEMGAFKPGGRISFYGSYWNLSNGSNSSGCSSGESDGNPHSPNAAETTTSANTSLTPNSGINSRGDTNAEYVSGLGLSERQNYRRNNNALHISSPLTNLSSSSSAIPAKRRTTLNSDKSQSSTLETEEKIL